MALHDLLCIGVCIAFTAENCANTFSKHMFSLCETIETVDGCISVIEMSENTGTVRRGRQIFINLQNSNTPPVCVMRCRTMFDQVATVHVQSTWLVRGCAGKK